MLTLLLSTIAHCIAQAASWLSKEECLQPSPRPNHRVFTTPKVQTVHQEAQLILVSYILQLACQLLRISYLQLIIHQANTPPICFIVHEPPCMPLLFLYMLQCAPLVCLHYPFL